MRRRRWRSRNPTKGSKKRIFFFVMLITFVLTVQSFVFIERNLRAPLMNVAKIRVKQIATNAINKALTEKISQGTNFDKLIDWKYDNKGQISGFMLNYLEHMKIATEAVDVVRNTFDNLQSIPEHIPLGQALDSAILASFGPDIPFRFVPAGAVKVDLNTRKQDAGINMLLVEVYIRIIAEVTIIIPFDTEPEVVSTEIPISYVLVKGDVPMYYFDAKGNPVGTAGNNPVPPSIALPDVQSMMGREQNDPSATDSAGPSTTITK